MRTLSSLAAAAIATASLTLIPSSAHAADAQPAALTDAVTWLTSKTNSEGLLPGFDGTTGSIGTTADVVKSLAEVGAPTAARASAVVAAARAELSDDYRSSQEIAAGLWASELGSADQSLLGDLNAHISDGTGTFSVTSYPPPSYAPVTSTKTAAPAAKGRLTDTTFNEYTGTDAQAWAVLALAQAGSAKTADALAYLLGQQCADGGFRTKFSSVDATAQTCSDDTASTDSDLTESSPDATGSAVIFLSALPTSAKSAAVVAAVTKAVDWLVAHQATDGGFSEYYGVSGNSTGLAGRALVLSGKTASAAKAALWLRSHQAQAAGSCVSPIAKDRGAISYDDDTFGANKADGLDAAAVGSAVSVTAQSLAALAAAPAGNPTPSITQTPAAVAPGATATLTITGALAGDELCLTYGGSSRLLPAGTTTTTVTAPTGVASAPVIVSTASGATASTSLAINTSAKLKVTAKKKVKRGKRLAVTVRGLWAGEQVTIKRGKVKLGTAKANAAGTATVKVKIAKKTRTGKKTLAVFGAFANRTGTTKIKVTR